MSIIPLVKVTIYGRLADKARVLDDLQQMGCLHLIPLSPRTDLRDQGPSRGAREALRFLEECPQERRQMRTAGVFDAQHVQERALQIRDQLLDLRDRRDALVRRIGDLKPWGDFHFDPLIERGKQQRLWFYQVPRYQMKRVEESDLVWEVVGEDDRFFYVVVISPVEPQDMPAPRTRTGAKPLSVLEHELEEIEHQIEDLEVERSSLTRWLTMFREKLNRLEDRAEFIDAFVHAMDHEDLFVVQGWAPAKRADELRIYSHRGGVAVLVEKPGEDDEPPTLLENQPALAPGEDLVSFYMTPRYTLWDPSAIVLLSFSLFFAMIISDAGYAAVMAVLLLAFWKRLEESSSGRRVRTMFAFLVAASVAWGVIAGSYFGLAPAPGSWLSRLQLVNLEDSETMMRLSIWIGAIHVAIANLAEAWRRRSSSGALAPLGWVVVIAGAMTLYTAMALGPAALEQAKPFGYGGMIAGGALVLLFTGAGEKLGGRAVSGLLGLARISNAFGDILSYLRLFALGLASASLALAFNDLARQVVEAIPGFGYLLAAIILVVGHGLNFTLAIVSGFVHGLRLNVIEFFNWGLPEEGRPFRAFRKKEAT